MELNSQVSTLTSSENQKQSHIGELENRLMELEQRNSQLVDNLQQLAQEKSSTAPSQIENLTNVCSKFTLITLI